MYIVVNTYLKKNYVDNYLNVIFLANKNSIRINSYAYFKYNGKITTIPMYKI